MPVHRCILSTRTQIDIIQSLQLTGGATNSIFPEAEAILNAGDYIKALEFVGSRKNMTRYQSVMDFLFCELHQEWQWSCFKYYAGMGPQLSEMISVDQLIEYNGRLLLALEIALKLHEERQRIAWVRYRKLVNDAARAA